MKSMDIDEARNVQLEILTAVDKFCNANDLRYFLSYGTLLGAIRHNGFIPWDDDIDITMPYPDYRQFIEQFRHDIYRVNSVYLNPEYPYHLVKIDDRRTKLIEHTDKEIDIGINIDVSPLIGLPSDKDKAIKHFKRIDFWRSKVLLAKNVVRKKRNICKQIPIELVKALPISRNTIIHKIDSLSSEYDFEQSKYAICVGSFNPVSEIADKSIFDSTEKHTFEGHLFNIPRGWDEWLKILFNDYMKLPPIEKQVTHHDFDCYWR